MDLTVLSFFWPVSFGFNRGTSIVIFPSSNGIIFLLDENWFCLYDGSHHCNTQNPQ